MLWVTDAVCGSVKAYRSGDSRWTSKLTTPLDIIEMINLN